jgi:molecular chaperone HtpG
MGTMSETKEFKAELKQLLHLITHSLYSDKEIFLRELISNASDAINKAKFDSLDKYDLLQNDKDWRITIRVDKDLNTLTVSDNGVGMSQEEVIQNLGTIAHSGTKAFLERSKEALASNRPDLIGQFGVGFYSSFMVADKVTVITRRIGATEAEAVSWTSDGQGTYSVESTTRPRRGTDVILHLKEDAREDFLEPGAIRGLVRKFSDFLENPVFLEHQVTEKDETKWESSQINSSKAIWLRAKSEVTTEEYNEFYKQVGNDFETPAKVIHYSGEGFAEFRVLLFIPKQRPYDFEFYDPKYGPKLYVQRVLIQDHCAELIPPYLRFVRGVVDCPDLPLNVSREILQDNVIIQKIRKDITKEVLKALKDLKSSEPEVYRKFFSELGQIVKEGIRIDFEHKERIMDLMLFESLLGEAEKPTDFAEYVGKMALEQKDVFHLGAESRQVALASPVLEAFRKRSINVLFLTDPVDQFILPYMNEYKGRKLVAADQGEIPGLEAVTSEEEATYAEFLDKWKEWIPGLTKARLSTRLEESPACLVSSEGQSSAHMERLLKRMGRSEGMPAPERIVELNPRHPFVKAMNDLFKTDPSSSKLIDSAKVLTDLATMAEGSRVEDPTLMVKRVVSMMEAGLRS